MMSSFEYGPDGIRMGRPFAFRPMPVQASTGLPHGSSRIHGGNLLRLFACIQYLFLQEFREDAHSGLPEHGEMVPGN
jgi:hypothetical protein